MSRDTRVPTQEYLNHIAKYFQQIEALWEGPDGCAEPGTILASEIVLSIRKLAREPMALGLKDLPPMPVFDLFQYQQKTALEEFVREAEETLGIRTHVEQREEGRTYSQIVIDTIKADQGSPSPIESFPRWWLTVRDMMNSIGLLWHDGERWQTYVFDQISQRTTAASAEMGRPGPVRLCLSTHAAQKVYAIFKLSECRFVLFNDGHGGAFIVNEPTDAKVPFPDVIKIFTK